MKIVAIGQIIELNNILKENQLPYKIHLRDACAMQSFSIEVLEIENDEDKNLLSEIIETYFLKQNMIVSYTKDKYHFIIK